MIVAGNIYAYGVWSESMAAQWPDKHNSQSKTSSLYEIALIGNYLPFAGFFYHRFGARSSIIAGAAMNLMSYLIIYFQFFVNEEQGMNPDWLTYVAFFFVGHSTGYVDSAVVGTNLNNFQMKDRGAAMGLLKGYFGLAASIVAVVHGTGISSSSFFLFYLALLHTAILMSLCWFIIVVDDQVISSKVSKLKLDAALLVEILIALLLFGYSLVGQSGHFVSVVVLVSVSILFGSTCSLFLIKDSFWFRGFSRLPSDDLIQLDDDATHFGSESLTLKQACTSLSMQVFFAMLFIIMGAGLFLVSNIAKIMKSKEETDYTSTLVSLFSVSNCFGRLAVGFISDLNFFSSRSLFRPAFLSLALVLMGAAHAAFAVSSSPYATMLAGVVGGFAYGASWTSSPAIVADICGMGHFGQVYGLVGLAPTFGSLLFSNVLASIVYESHAGDDDSCVGNQCFGAAHWITSGMCCFGAFVLGPILIGCTKRLYQVS